MDSPDSANSALLDKRTVGVPYVRVADTLVCLRFNAFLRCSYLNHLLIAVYRIPDPCDVEVPEVGSFEMHVARGYKSSHVREGAGADGFRAEK